MDLESAIKAHGEWKFKLRGAIQQKTTLDVTTIQVDDKCPLGEWLHGEAQETLASLKTYADCLSKHAAFHKEAAQVAATVNAGKYDQATAMLEAGTRYAEASSAVGAAILALKREAKL